MTSMSLMPGIHQVSINNENDESPIIRLSKEIETKINVNFTLTGMNRLLNPISLEKSTFFLYIFLTYQNGGKETVIVSSAEIFCDENILKEDNLHFSTSLDMPKNNTFSNEDFVWNYYSLEIIHSDFQAEDASDINQMLMHSSNALFSTKLNVSCEGN